MIVLIAAGGQPNLTLNPLVDSDDDRVHRGHSAGGCRDRLDGLQDDLRGGATLFIMTLAMNLLAIRLVRRFREVYE